MMSAIEALADCPQTRMLTRLVYRLVRRDDVQAIWLGGSFAVGAADRYSDVDLRVAVNQDSFNNWSSIDLHELFLDPCPGAMTMGNGVDNVLHHILLSNGEIFDLYVQPFPPSSVELPIMILWTRDGGYTSQTSDHAPPSSVSHRTIPDGRGGTIREVILANQAEPNSEVSPASGPEIDQLIRHFWINSHKHRKVLDRDLDLVAQIGLRLEQDVLRRLWYVLLTGLDDARFKTIHTLTAQLQAISEHMEGPAFKLLGMPLRTRAEIVFAIEATRDEVSTVGKQLAKNLTFPYPADLEALVRHGWDEWRSSSS